MEIHQIENGTENEGTLHVFSGISFMTKIGSLHIDAVVSESIGDLEQSDYLYMDALVKVEGIANRVAKGDLDWCPSKFLSIYSEYTFAFDEAINRAEISSYYKSFRVPGAVGSVTVYCSRGCNWDTSPADMPIGECAACGSLMHPLDQDRYYDSLVRAGQAM